MSKSMLHVIGLSVLMTLAGCGRGDGEGEGKKEKEVGAVPTNRIDIPAMVRKNLGITFVKVERRSVARTIRVPGSFELEPLARREYRSMLAGRVRFAVNQFDRVKVGDVLYRFQSPGWPELQHEIIEAEQKIATSRANIEVARASLGESMVKRVALDKRLKALTEANFKRADLVVASTELAAKIGKQEVEIRAAEVSLANAERDYEHAVHVASAAVGLDEKALTERVMHEGKEVSRYQTIDWMEVKATHGGVVESLDVTDGTFVDAKTRMITTMDVGAVRFKGLGLQSDLGRLVDGAEVRLVPPRGGGDDANYSVKGRLVVGLHAHADDRTVSLYGKPVEREEWMRPGVSAFMEIGVESTEGVVLAIPKSAVVRDGIVHVFFKRDPANAGKAIRMEAELGVDDGKWVEIKSGVGPNDSVVLDGVYELKLAMSRDVNAQKGGHFHADGTFHADGE